MKALFISGGIVASHRYISTTFWDDEWIQTLDPSEKLLYLYYMTNPLTNVAGIYKIAERRVSFDTGFNIDVIRMITSKFQKSKKAMRFGEWIILPKWTKHQVVIKEDGSDGKKTRENNIKKGIDSLLKDLPDDVFYFALANGYSYSFISDIGRPLEDPSRPLKGLPEDSKEDPYKGLQDPSRPLNYSILDSTLSNLDSIKIDTETFSDDESFADDPPPQPRFKKPTSEEVAAYCSERRNGINAQRFIDYQESRGWKIGKAPMKDWKAAVRTWEQNDRERAASSLKVPQRTTFLDLPEAE